MLEISCQNTKVWRATMDRKDVYVAEHEGHREIEKTGAEAVAKLLLWLIEEEHVDNLTNQ